MNGKTMYRDGNNEKPMRDKPNQKKKVAMVKLAGTDTVMVVQSMAETFAQR